MEFIKKHYSLTVVTVAIVVIVAGIFVSRPHQTDSNTQPSTTATTATEKQKKIVMSGTGKTATPEFELVSGLRRVTMTHDGHDNFIVELLDTDGNEVETLANEIGKFNGSTAFQADSGKYLVTVEGDGHWTVTIQ